MVDEIEGIIRALEQIMDADLRGLAAVRHRPRLPPLSPSCRNGSNSPMAEGDLIRIIPHRGVDDDSGSLEVWFADGRKSIRFYWDNLVSRRLRESRPSRKPRRWRGL